MIQYHSQHEGNRIAMNLGFGLCSFASVSPPFVGKSPSICDQHESFLQFSIWKQHSNPRALCKNHSLICPESRRSFSLVCRSDYTQLSQTEGQRYADALTAGIKAVAVGKNGVRPVPENAINSIMEALFCMDIWNRDVDHDLARISDPNSSVASNDGKFVTPMALCMQRASLLGSLFVKAEISPSEMQVLQFVVDRTSDSTVGRVRNLGSLQCSAGDILEYVLPGVVVKLRQHSHVHSSCESIANYALRLLNNEYLDRDDAYKLGRLLFSADNNDRASLPLKALIAHVMRIRHESSDEIAGLAAAAASSLNDNFLLPSGLAEFKKRPVAHLAEPFDGTVTWDLITPVLGQHLITKHGFSVVFAAGISSGPKYGPNLRDVAIAMDLPFAHSARELMSLLTSTQGGVVVDQVDCSNGLAAWVDIRRAIVKRPALATVEKFVDAVPGGSSLFISSAFHESYIEKMIAAAESMRYPCYIIVAKGVEGTLGLGVGSRSKASLHVGVRDSMGSYVRTEIVVDTALAGESMLPDDLHNYHLPEKGSATASRTADLTRRWQDCGKSGDRCFDARVNSTLRAFDKAMAFISSKVE